MTGGTGRFADLTGNGITTTDANVTGSLADVTLTGTLSRSRA